MPKMRAIPQLVSVPSNPIPIVEHFGWSHPQCKHSYGQEMLMRITTQYNSNEPLNYIKPLMSPHVSESGDWMQGGQFRKGGRHKLYIILYFPNAVLSKLG